MKGREPCHLSGRLVDFLVDLLLQVVEVQPDLGDLGLGFIQVPPEGGLKKAEPDESFGNHHFMNQMTIIQ